MEANRLTAQQSVSPAVSYIVSITFACKIRNAQYVRSSSQAVSITLRTDEEESFIMQPVMQTYGGPVHIGPHPDSR